MPGRQFNTANYRYGFNGKENDNEVKGVGNSVDFGERIYDSRLGRFLKRDFYSEDTPDLTPYRFGLNNPIRFTDSEGQFEVDETTAKNYPKLNAYLQNIVKEYAGKPEEFRKAFKQYSELTDAQINTMLTYKVVKDGTPTSPNQPNPRIIVKNLLHANGETPGSAKGIKNNKLVGESNSGIIYLNETIVNEYEKSDNFKTEVEKATALLVVESTIFHEATHYGDVLSDNETTQTGYTINNHQVSVNTVDDATIGQKEGGKAFEKAVYGQDIDPSNAKQYVERKDYNGAATKDFNKSVRTAVSEKAVAKPDALKVQK